jgi:SagB-type dehydrogenase family enzyme
MTGRDTDVVRDYLHAVLHRGPGPMAPAGYRPDLTDQPWPYKVYPDATRIPLPESDPSPPPGPAFTMASLSAMLRQSYGLTSRRLRVDGNGNGDTQPWHKFSVWGRGAASGGGLYPLEIYWAAGAGAPIAPGIYHYSPAHHALDRLLAGDVTERVRSALGPESANHHQHLVVAARFWRSAFKYADYSYHVVTMDVGALLGAWAAWARAEETELRPRLWFHEAALNDLLGLDPTMESVMAVVPLPWHPAAARPTPTDTSGTEPFGPAGAVCRPVLERSHHIVRFSVMDDVHAATMTADRLDPEALARAAPPCAADTPRSASTLPLAPPDSAVLDGDQRHLLACRRSAFGLLTREPSLPAADLGTILAAGSRAGLLRSDATDAGGAPALTRLGVFVNQVAGVPAGTYRYDRDRHRLDLLDTAPPGPFLQRSYFLSNYNLDRAAAVVAVQGRPEAVIQAAGDRGYRLLNAAAGALAQAIYLASAALGLGCGAVLGFDCVALAGRLALSGTDEWPVLLMLVGPPQPDVAEIDYRL